MSKLSPSLEEIERLRATAPDGPVTIVNLMKFKPGPEARAAYQRYLDEALGARHPDCEVVHSGPAFADVAGGSDWDYAIVARYPKFDDFAWSVTHPAWRAAARHRPDALERTLMIVSPAGRVQPAPGAD